MDITVLTSGIGKIFRFLTTLRRNRGLRVRYYGLLSTLIEFIVNVPVEESVDANVYRVLFRLNVLLIVLEGHPAHVAAVVIRLRHLDHPI